MEQEDKQVEVEETVIKDSAKDDLEILQAKLATQSAYDRAEFKEDQDGYIHVILPRSGGEIILGPPKLKHRKIILSILKSFEMSDETKAKMDEFAKNRGITIKKMAMIEEADMTEEEKKFFSENEELEEISAMTSEIIFVTLRKTPWDKDGKLATLDELEEHMEYPDALKLISPAMSLISNSLISAKERKN